MQLPILSKITIKISASMTCAAISALASYLTKIFKQVHHVSPYDYLLGVRMNKASLLLQTTALPIKQIAEMVGYKDALVFSKAFKQKIGTSPRAFRDSSATLVFVAYQKCMTGRKQHICAYVLIFPDTFQYPF